MRHVRRNVLRAAPSSLSEKGLWSLQDRSGLNTEVLESSLHKGSKWGIIEVKEYLQGGKIKVKSIYENYVT